MQQQEKSVGQNHQVRPYSHVFMTKGLGRKKKSLKPEVHMKTKKIFDTKFATPEKAPMVTPKPKSLRPMRSMVAVRSMKSKTSVAAIVVKLEETAESR